MDIKKAITHYCQYQPRCHKEVRNKLYELGCTTPEVENHLADMIATGVLNEEQYAKAIARGKFNLKKWGRVKIRQLLKQNQVSEYCIQKGLDEIDLNNYYSICYKLASIKFDSVKSDRSAARRKQKVYNYLTQKGYESSLVTEVMNQILQENAH